MYFSKVIIPTGTGYFSFLKESRLDNMYHAHQLLWKLFSNNPEAERDFIFREYNIQNRTYYYLVSQRRPETIFGIDIQTKVYSPRMQKGDMYHFTLRANPVITKKSNGKKNSVQHDVLMNAKKEARIRNYSSEDEYNFIREKTIDWLHDKAVKNGFSVNPEKVNYEQYIQHTLYKKNKQQIKFSTVDYEGILQVEEPNTFIKALFHGIGKKKAFGCGLMLIKPI